MMRGGWRRWVPSGTVALLGVGATMVVAAIDFEPRGKGAVVLAGGVLTAFVAWIVHREVWARTVLAQRVDTDAARFEALVEHSHDVISVITAEALLTYISPGVQTVFGHDPDDLVGRRVAADLIHPDDLDEALAALDGITRLGPRATGYLHIRFRTADGRWRHTETAATNLLGDGVVDGIVLNTRDITAWVEAEEALRWQARHDALTGLANRTELLERLDGAGRRRRLGETEHIAVLFLDLDGFKAVNDLHGHAAGDGFLVEAAERIVGVVRPGDTVARLGGDEFVVVAEQLAAPEDADQMAGRLLEVLSRPFELAGGEQVRCTASIGVAMMSAHTTDTLLRAADDALYRAKRQGRNRYESAAAAS